MVGLSTVILDLFIKLSENCSGKISLWGICKGAGLLRTRNCGSKLNYLILKSSHIHSPIQLLQACMQKYGKSFLKIFLFQVPDSTLHGLKWISKMDWNLSANCCPPWTTNIGTESLFPSNDHTELHIFVINSCIKINQELQPNNNV